MKSAKEYNVTYHSILENYPRYKEKYVLGKPFDFNLLGRFFNEIKEGDWFFSFALSMIYVMLKLIITPV